MLIDDFDVCVIVHWHMNVKAKACSLIRCLPTKCVRFIVFVWALCECQCVSAANLAVHQSFENVLL